MFAVGSCGYHRVTEWLRLEGTSSGHLAQPLGQEGSPTASCPGRCPGSFSISQRWRLHNLSVQPVPLLGHHHSHVLPEVQRFPWFSKRFHLAYGAEPVGFSSFFSLLLLILCKKIQLMWPQIWGYYLHMSPKSVCLTTQISVCSGYCAV